MKLDFDPIDMHEVSNEHDSVHERLIEWARWCAPGSFRAALPSPMFRHYKPYLHPETERAGTPIDTIRAVATQKAFVQLPGANRDALSWAYVYPFVNMGKACRMMAVSQDGLLVLIVNGRTMVKNLLTKENR